MAAVEFIATVLMMAVSALTCLDADLIDLLIEALVNRLRDDCATSCAAPH
jgi:hypothetical protein